MSRDLTKEELQELDKWMQEHGFMGYEEFCEKFNNGEFNKESSKKIKRLVGNFNQEYLNELSEADVKMGKCPVCNMQGLENDNGVKYCPYCNSRFKMFRGKIYLI